MAINVAAFRARFPEFADDTEYPDARIQVFIDDALSDLGTNETRWNGKYDRAQSYLSAHLLVVGTKSEGGDSSSSAGIVQSKSAGGVSVSKSFVAKDRSELDDWYASTTYGQQFLIIRNQTFVGVLVANCL